MKRPLIVLDTSPSLTPVQVDLLSRIQMLWRELVGVVAQGGEEPRTRSPEYDRIVAAIRVLSDAFRLEEARSWQDEARAS